MIIIIIIIIIETYQLQGPDKGRVGYPGGNLTTEYKQWGQTTAEQS